MMITTEAEAVEQIASMGQAFVVVYDDGKAMRSPHHALALFASQAVAELEAEGRQGHVFEVLPFGARDFPEDCLLVDAAGEWRRHFTPQHDSVGRLCLHKIETTQQEEPSK